MLLGLRRELEAGGEENVERRLAAILAADVVGYSRMMEVDEADTLARLKAHLGELSDPKSTAHRGNIVKTTGDGLLAEFASVVAAVECAVEIQRDMAKRNASGPTAGRSVPHRHQPRRHHHRRTATYLAMG